MLVNPTIVNMSILQKSQDLTQLNPHEQTQMLNQTNPFAQTLPIPASSSQHNISKMFVPDEVR